MDSLNLDKIIKKEVYLHLLFWVFYIALPLFKYSGNEYSLIQWVTSHSNLPLVVIVVYTSYLFIFPLRNKYVLTIISSFLILMTIFGVLVSKLIIHLFIYQIDNYSYKTHGLAVLGEYIFVCLIFYSFYSFKKSYQLNNSLKVAELKNLKTQINPHFLFNTLNSIYSYSLRNDKKGSDLILKLSDNFKYVLNQGQKEKVKVSEDWQHIRDFIYIHKLRWEDKISFEINEDIQDQNLLIAPLILITFIENAVKYTSKLKGGNHKISIDIKVNNHGLSFQCSNPYNKEYNLSEDWQSSGIGLENTKNRLDLLYSGRYNFDIDDNGSLFQTSLNIET